MANIDDIFKYIFFNENIAFLLKFHFILFPTWQAITSLQRSHNGHMVSQITSLTIVYSTFQSGANQRKYQSSASLAFVRGIHWWPVNSPHKGPVTRKMFPFDDVIMCTNQAWVYWCICIPRSQGVVILEYIIILKSKFCHSDNIFHHWLHRKLSKWQLLYWNIS